MINDCEKYLCKKAFTLAEVLITLAVIGVVAAMAIPSLQSNIKDKQFRVSWKKAFSVLSDATAAIKQEQGGSFKSIIEASGVSAGQLGPLQPELLKQMNVLKDCGAHSCFSSTTDPRYNYKVMSGGAYTSAFADEGQFVTNDGMFYMIQNSGNVTIGVLISVDVNGYEKGPNIMGRDLFMARLLEDRLVPMGAPGSGAEDSCSSDVFLYGYTGNFYNISGAGCSAQYLYEE